MLLASALMNFCAFLLQVHIILGLGSFSSNIDEKDIGVIADVGAPVNDPVFFLHHTTIDCILEAWLMNAKMSSYPVSEEIRLGHKSDDYIVPFIPLYTHEDMFKTAENFGYECNLFNVDISSTSSYFTFW